MAKATAKTTTVINEITLTLTPEEAQALRDVCQNISGNSKTSRRKFFNYQSTSIDEVLKAAGVGVTGQAFNRGLTGTIDFNS